MRRLRVPLIVEGKYDKAVLSSVVEGTIIVTNGFGIFKDKKRLALIQKLAAEGPVALLTDSDRAGFLIRGHLAGAIPKASIIQLYTPEIYGKEKRKAHPSAEGKLGVEGMASDLLLKLLDDAGLLEDSVPAADPLRITKADLYRLGLSGRDDSAKKRSILLQELDLPQGLSANALPGILSRLMPLGELEALTARLFPEK